MSKILVVMCDNRPLETQAASSAGYHSLAVFINSLYCERHGYDFLFYSIRDNSLGAFFRDVRNVGVSRFFRAGLLPIKSRACCYNKSLEEYRAASWAKLLVVKDALSLNYPMVVYIDSDCIFLDQNLRIEEFIDKTQVSAGSAFQNSCVGFLKDHPFHDDLPCAGFFVMKNTPESSSFLSEWWNFPNASYNFAHNFEQSSLHKMFASRSDIICVWESFYLVQHEGQFLRHIACYDGDLRLPYFLKVASDLELSSKERFEHVMTRVKTRSLRSFAW